MEILHAHSHVAVVLCQLFRHSLGQGGDQDAIPLCDAVPDLSQKIVHLVLDGPHDNLRIHETRRPDDLLHHLAPRPLELVRSWGGRDVEELPHAVPEFVEGERPVVDGRRKSKAEFHQSLFPGSVAPVHSLDLRHGHVTLVQNHQGVRGEIIQQCGRRFARVAAREVARVVFDALAVANLLDHL